MPEEQRTSRHGYLGTIGYVIRGRFGMAHGDTDHGGCLNTVTTPRAAIPGPVTAPAKAKHAASLGLVSAR